MNRVGVPGMCGGKKCAVHLITIYATLAKMDDDIVKGCDDVMQNPFDFL